LLTSCSRVCARQLCPEFCVGGLLLIEVGVEEANDLVVSQLLGPGFRVLAKLPEHLVQTLDLLFRFFQMRLQCLLQIAVCGLVY
jgi:hypothetical protein